MLKLNKLNGSFSGNTLYENYWPFGSILQWCQGAKVPWCHGAKVMDGKLQPDSAFSHRGVGRVKSVCGEGIHWGLLMYRMYTLGVAHVTSVYTGGNSCL